MKIGIIGTGGVGVALGDKLRAHRSICYGTRDINSAKAKEILTKQQGVLVKPIAEAVDSSDVVIVAVPGVAVRDADGVAKFAESLGPKISGKIVIDATNPMTPFPDVEVLWNGTSGGELMQAGLPGAKVYKAFNTVGTSLMLQPDVLGTPISLMFAGPDDPSAKEQVAAIIKEVGFEPFYVGPIRYARNLEAIGELWTHLAVPPAGFTKEDFSQYFAFNVVKRPQ
eukprot:gene4733-4983_t